VPVKPQLTDFKILDHTADVGIIAYGTDLKQAFANAARGMFSLITELKSIRGVLQREVAVNATDLESLLVTWLNELIYLFDTENFLGKRFEITELDNTHLKAEVYGEKVDRSRNHLKIGIKATTYHMLQIKQDNGYQVRVIFDI
jgi:SHS2 domain-containing protein